MIKYDGLKSIIALTSFTPEFFKGQQQEGWKREGELKNILNQLYIRVANSSHRRKNFLISEQPEDGLLTGPIKGRRAEFFSLSVKGTKMAVPVFNNPLQDQELKAVLDGEYPFDFVLVDPSISEEELKKDGFQYVLYNAHSQAKNVHDLLGYESDKSISVYATIHHEKNKNEVRTIPLDQYVYKYYLKHLISGTTYLGTEWDVSATWRQALLNHLRSYKKGVGIN